MALLDNPFFKPVSNALDLVVQGVEQKRRENRGERLLNERIEREETRREEDQTRADEQLKKRNLFSFQQSLLRNKGVDPEFKGALAKSMAANLTSTKTAIRRRATRSWIPPFSRRCWTTTLTVSRQMLPSRQANR